MKTLGYYNGKISPLQELMIPANDRCVYYGDGVYDAAYGRCGNIFAADEHIERFMNSCRMLSITPGFSNSELKAVLYRLVEEAEADFVLCLYNPASRTRKDHLARACQILLRYREPETLCGLARNIGREGEKIRLLSLEELKNTQADMFTTVFVGSSQTRNIGERMVTPRGYRTGEDHKGGAL